jgi:hypothetical protein
MAQHRQPAAAGDLRVSRGEPVAARPEPTCAVVARFEEDGALTLEVTGVAEWGRDGDEPLLASATYDEIPDHLRQRVEKALRAVLEDCHDACAERAEDAALRARVARRG